MLGNLDPRPLLVALFIGLLVGALGSWYLTAEYKDAKWGKAISDQKVEAGKTLQAETEKVLAAEREQHRLNTLLETKDAEAQTKINTTLADNRRLARELGGLRDPGRRPSCDTTQAADTPTSSTSAGTAGTELSAEATDFLLEFAADADRAAQYAKTCREWARSVAEVKP